MALLQAEMFPAGGYVVQPDLVLTPDGEESGIAVVVRDGKIAAIGSASEVTAANACLPVRVLKNCAVVPGFVDAHHHVLDPFAKAMTFGEPAQIWRRVWMPLEATATAEDCYLGAKWSFLEAMRGGITCIVDHAMRPPEMLEPAIRAADETGIRFVTSVGAYDKAPVQSLAKYSPHVSIDDALNQAERHRENCGGRTRVHPSVACGNAQTNTPEMIAEVSGYCRDSGMLFQIHANEHTPEVHYAVETYGKRPIELLHSIGALGSHTLVAHATLTTSREVALLRETDTAVSYNPIASMWKGNAVAPALTYIRNGIRVGIGSDVTRNDGFRMVEAAETCQRIAYGIPVDDFSCGAGWVWLDAATRGGASAAGLGDVTGALRVGKDADFLVLDMSLPEVLPSWDFTWELVRFYDKSNLLGVFVEGMPTLLHGVATRLDSVRFVDDYREYAERRVSNSNLVRIHGPSRHHRPIGTRKRL